MAKAKQGHLEGMEPPTIKELDEAADNYMDIRDKRMAMTRKECSKQDHLQELMKEHKLTVYEYDGYIVTLNQTEKVKVRKRPEGEPSANGDGDDEEPEEE